MKHIHSLIGICVSGFMLTACSAPQNANVEPLPTATTAVSSVQSAIPTATPTEIPAEPFLSATGILPLKLLTDIAGAGAKPLFQWDAVPAADRYQVIVFDESGDPYWAWEGTQTQIYMGGTQEQPPVDSSGPSIGWGYTWSVVAYGSDGKLLAASEVRSISP